MAMYNDTPYQNYVEQNFYLTLEMSPCVHAKRKAYLLLLGDRLLAGDRVVVCVL